MRNSKIPRNIIVLGVVSLLTDAATEMIYPLIPIFVAALGSGALMLGVIEGTYSSWYVAASIAVEWEKRSPKRFK